MLGRYSENELTMCDLPFPDIRRLETAQEQDIHGEYNVSSRHQAKQFTASGLKYQFMASGLKIFAYQMCTAGGKSVPRNTGQISTFDMSC